MKKKRFSPSGPGRRAPSDRPPRRGGHRPPGPVAQVSESPRTPHRHPPGRWVIGLHSVREAIKVRPKAVQSMWLREDYLRSHDLKELSQWALSRKVRIEPKAESVLDRFGGGHQGVAVQMNEGPAWTDQQAEKEGPQLLVVLDGIQDPHNLGAILRTCWLMGAGAVFVPEHRAAPLTPVAMKVASGAAEHVPVVIHDHLPQLLERLKSLNYWIYGLSASGRSSLWQVAFPEKVVLVIGAEGKGLRVTVERSCDELISIPQVDSEASFNASVATALALGEVVRQRSLPPQKP